MIGKGPQAHYLEGDLEQYIQDQEPTPLRDFVDEQARRAPWCIMSLVVHLVALWVMYQWPVSMAAQERVISAPVAVNLITEQPRDIVETPPAEDLVPEIVQEETFDLQDIPLDVPIEDIPLSNEPVGYSPGSGGGTGGGVGTGVGEGTGPGVDLGLPQVGSDALADAWRPVESIDPPSNTPVFGVLDPTRHGSLTRGIYSGRGNRSGGRFIGGGGGSSVRAESTVNAGLIWLAKAQEKDGHWDCLHWDGGGNYDVGMTGLALLAFEGAGYTHTKGRYRDTVARALDWLRYNQKPNGSFGWQTFYEQGIATTAVSEAYGLTRSEGVRRMAQKAVDFIIATQPDHGGFRYGGAVPKEEGDMSVTGWQIMALKSAICSELTVPSEAIERSRVFLRNTFRDYGGSSYIVSQQNSAPAVTAIGMLCRQFIGGDPAFDAQINASANYLFERERNQGGARGGRGGQKDVLVRDLYYTYYSVLAMFQMGGEYWTQWNRMFREPLVALQEQKSILDAKGRFIRGSWDPADTAWGAQGGRIFSTAMAILSLEVYYRFLPVYRICP